MLRLSAMATLALLLPLSLQAQSVSSVQAFTVPSDNAGTCIAPTRPRGAGHADSLRRSTLSIMTTPPGGSRQMSMVRNRDGTIVAYSEMSSVFVPPQDENGDIIVAVLGRAGRVTGTWTHVTIEMPDPRTVKLDTASLRKAGRGTVRDSTKRALTPAETRELQTITAWLSKRCPA